MSLGPSHKIQNTTQYVTTYNYWPPRPHKDIIHSHLVSTQCNSSFTTEIESTKRTVYLLYRLLISLTYSYKTLKTDPNVHPHPSEFTAIHRNISYAFDKMLVKCSTKGNYFLIKIKLLPSFCATQWRCTVDRMLHDCSSPGLKGRVEI